MDFLQRNRTTWGILPFGDNPYRGSFVRGERAENYDMTGLEFGSGRRVSHLNIVSAAMERFGAVIERQVNE
jgi:hypothetical protein